MGGEESKALRLAALIANDRLFRLKENNVISDVAVNSKVGDRDAVAFELSKDEARLKLYFDAKSSLLLKQERETPDGLVETFYDDYRAVDGVMEPFAIKFKGEGKEQDVTVEIVEHDKRIDQTAIANQEKVEELVDHYTYRQTDITHIRYTR